MKEWRYLLPLISHWKEERHAAGNFKNTSNHEYFPIPYVSFLCFLYSLRSFSLFPLSLSSLLFVFIPYCLPSVCYLSPSGWQGLGGKEARVLRHTWKLAMTSKFRGRKSVPWKEVRKWVKHDKLYPTTHFVETLLSSTPRNVHLAFAQTHERTAR